MEMMLNQNFEGIQYEELIHIDGGVDWNFVGQTASTVSGGYIGAKIGGTIGTAGGPVGTVVGGIAGAVVGAVVYSLWD